MWDEITVSLPAGSESNATIDQIREAVLQETAADARLAEQEWRRVTRQSSVGVSHFTADLAVDMRPGGSGIDVIVRYVTRASSRFDRKNRLYQCVLPLLRRSGAGEAVSRGPQPIREESLCDEPCAGTHGLPSEAACLESQNAGPVALTESQHHSWAPANARNGRCEVTGLDDPVGTRNVRK